MKSFLLKLGGFAAYIGTPLSLIAIFGQVIVTKGVAVVLSASAMVIVVISIGVFRYIFKKDAVPVKPNMMWIILTVFFGLCYFMQDVVLQWFAISASGVVGTFGGSALFNLADKVAAKAEKEKEQDKLVAKLKAEIGETK